MVKDIGIGLQSTISTVTAARTFATDARNIVTLTASHIAWVHAGMKKKYGKGLYPETVADFSKYRKLWRDAQALIKDGQNWDRALMYCQDIFDECLCMAVMHDLIDYDVFDMTVTEKLFGGGDDSEKGKLEQEPAECVRRG